MKLVVNEIRAKGFRNHEEERIFTFSEYNLITGDNGKGKSTFSDLIMYLLYGCNRNGNNKSDSVLLNNKSKSMEVEGTITIDDKKYSIARFRKGSTTNVYLNGEKSSDGEIAKLLPPKDIFLSIFNLTYFPSLNASDGRSFLKKILPKLEKEDVVNELDDVSKKILQEAKFINANDYLQELRSAEKEYEKDNIYIEGAMDSKKADLSALIISDEINFDETELIQLKNSLINIEQSVKKPTYFDIEQLEKEKMSYEIEIHKLESINVNLGTKDLSEIKDRHSSLRGQYQLIEKKIAEFNLKVGAKCPTCQKDISAEDIDDTLSNFKEELKNIKEEGMLVAQEIKDIEKLNQEIVENNKRTISKTRQMLIDCIKDLGIDSLKDENVKIEKEYESNLLSAKAEILARIKILEEEQSKVNESNTKREFILKSKAEIEEKISKLELDVKKCKENIKKTKTHISAVQSFIAKYLELQQSFLSGHLDKVKLRLQKIVASTSEIKDVFELMYEDKPFNLLSDSEKIRASLEISNLIMHYSNCYVPIMIDNAESITSYKKPNTQILEARVVAGESLNIVN